MADQPSTLRERASTLLNRLSSHRSVLLWIAALIVTFAIAFFLGRHSSTLTVVTPTPDATTVPLAASSGKDTTTLYAHNLVLRKGSHFRVYVRWIRGEMLPTRTGQNPSFDAPESFVLHIQKGVINVKLADIADYLNNGTDAPSPLKNITIDSKDGQIQIHGTMHKVISLPVRLDGTLTPLPDGRLKYHLTKLNVLKIPMKGLFGLFSVKLDDLVKDIHTPGVAIADNDIYFDTQHLLPAPHLRGIITSVAVNPDSLTVVYGNTRTDEGTLAQWHNFLRLRGGNLDFGKLTMHDVDLTMIDASDDPWFDLDLVNYQAQLVYGTTRMTSKAGLEIYMPDLDHLPHREQAKGVTLEWLKNRSTAPPIEVPKK